MRYFCGALWHFVKNSFKLTNNNNMDNIQLLNPLKTLDMLWPNTRQTHRERVPSLSLSLWAGLNFLADYHSFAATERTLQLCLVQVFFGVAFPHCQRCVKWV